MTTDDSGSNFNLSVDDRFYRFHDSAALLARLQIEGSGLCDDHAADMGDLT